MNWLIFVVILRSVHESNESFLNSSSVNFSAFQNISSSVDSFIRAISKDFLTFEVIHFNENAMADDLINKILRISDKITFEVKRRTGGISTDGALKVLLMLCDEIEQIESYLTLNPIKVDGFLVVFALRQFSTREMKTIFEASWSKSLYNVDVLVQSQVFTFFPFQKGKCNDTSPKLVTELVDGSWTSANFFPEKFTSLHNCTIRASALDYSPVVIKTTYPNGSYGLDGTEVRFIREIAAVLNFQVVIDCSDTDHGSIFEENNTATGVVRHLFNGDSDIALGSLYLTSVRAKLLSPTEVYLLDSTRIVGARNPPYTPIEKLIRPFNIWLFVTIIVMLTTGCVSMVFLRKVLKSEGSALDPFNIVVVFLGGSQTSLSKKSFLRILVISFSLFCLVIRTIYQGSLFKLIQTDERTKGISTVDEMVEQKYKFYVTHSFGQTTKDMKFYKR